MDKPGGIRDALTALVRSAGRSVPSPVMTAAMNYPPRLLLLLALLPAMGCGAWRTPKWDLDALRDPRAVELDDRLSNQPSAVENPFVEAAPEGRPR